MNLNVMSTTVGLHPFRKVVATVRTTRDGTVGGMLKIDRGGSRILVSEWCRLWTGAETGGTVSMVHALGMWVDPAGRQMLVRLDVQNEEGGRLRVRTRPAVHGESMHADSSGVHDDSHDGGHGGWTSLTGNGWMAARIMQSSERGTGGRGR